MQDMEIPTRDMHNPRRVGLLNTVTGRDVIPRSLESAVLHPRRGDSYRCRVELRMHGPDCLGLSRPNWSAPVVHCLPAKDDAAASKQTPRLASQMMGP